MHVINDASTPSGPLRTSRTTSERAAKEENTITFSQSAACGGMRTSTRFCCSVALAAAMAACAALFACSEPSCAWPHRQKG